MLSAYLVRIVHRANTHVTWPVYVHWYCMPIATLNQNKQSRKLYFGNAHIMSTCWITSKFSSVCLQTCSSTFPILRPTYNLWNKIFIFLKLRHISNEDTLGSVPLVSIRLTENVDQYIRSINRELKQWRRRRQREWHKSNRFGSVKQQLCMTITFIVHFLPVVAQLWHETSHFHVLCRT